jgi:hypothetical protein
MGSIVTVLLTISGTLLQVLNTARGLLEELRGLRMDFTKLIAIMTQLRDDVSAETAAAVAAINAAKAGDQSQLDAAVASLTTTDKAVTDATAAFIAAVPATPAAEATKS